VRGCGRCGDQKRRGEYSANQWRAKPGESVCSGCVVVGGADNDGGGKRTAGGNGGGGKNKENGGGNNNHNNNSKNRAGIATNDRSDDGGNNGGNDYGNRGGFPPLSEAAGNGNSNNNSNNPSSSFPRLSEESLGRCKSTWGSSRAVMAIGQACHACTIDPSSVSDAPWVKPFRIEVVRSGGNGGGARPAGRNMRRKPREP
jgi:hypothetical protein